MSCERGGLRHRDVIHVCSIIVNIYALTMSNCDPWAAVVVNCNSSAVFVIYIVINNNSFAVCNFAGTGLKSVTDIILIVIKEVVVHKNLGGPAPVTVGTFDANAARIKWRPKGVVVDDIIVDGDIISSKIYSCSR